MRYLATTIYGDKLYISQVNQFDVTVTDGHYYVAVNRRLFTNGKLNVIGKAQLENFGFKVL